MDFSELWIFLVLVFHWQLFHSGFQGWMMVDTNVSLIPIENILIQLLFLLRSLMIVTLHKTTSVYNFAK